MAWPLITGALPAGLFAWGAYHPQSQLFGPTVRHTSTPHTIALTFDDGPNPAVTPQLLDLLDAHHARATFFVIGRFARAHPALVREIAVRGHALGNHTDTHPSLVWRSGTAIRRELLRCEDAVAEAAGVTPTLLRPPFGFRGPQLAATARRCGLTRIVMWSAIGRDWTQRAPVIRRRLARVRDRDIIVLHDGDHRRLGVGRTEMLDALGEWLPRWIERGWVPIVPGAGPEGRA